MLIKIIICRQGLARRVQRDAQSSRETVAKYIQKRTAVFKHWNIQKYLIIAKLMQPCYAFKGIIAPQSFGARWASRFPGKKYTKAVFWGGGFKQVLIKNITPAYCKIVAL